MTELTGADDFIARLFITMNSNDLACVVGYVNDNYKALCDAFDYNDKHFIDLARNSFAAAFYDESDRQMYL